MARPRYKLIHNQSIGLTFLFTSSLPPEIRNSFQTKTRSRSADFATFRALRKKSVEDLPAAPDGKRHSTVSLACPQGLTEDYTTVSLACPQGLQPGCCSSCIVV